MPRRWRDLHLVDTVVILASLLLLCIVLVFTVHNVMPLSDNWRVRAVILGSAVLAGVFAAIALIALISHLRLNRNSLYRENTR